jgi:ATP-dependent exoDNAse (exonuclease V) alpha subunit
LETQTAIPSVTLDRLLVELSQAEGGGFAPNTVVVVDEAAMVGTRKLATLLDHAQADRAKVVLVGDDRQLPAIDAGGAFAALARELGAVELAENRRQREPWEREALAELRAGEVEGALDAYQSRERVIVGISGEEVREFLVRDWWRARRSGEPALMLASRQSEVDTLNERARDHRFANGELGEELIMGGRSFAVGDEVLATRNDYRLGLLNGTRATVSAIDWECCVPVLETTDGQQVVPSSAYLAEGHLQHGYAMTVHKAQGATVAQSFVLGDDALYREAGYAALSRGREANTLYVVGRLDRRAEVRHASEVDADPFDEALTSLKRSEAKTLARDERVAELSRSVEIDNDMGIDLGW